ncbi:MAG: sarcosine oxidase subunit gamma [Pseudaminobacter sp.]|nr:sarcosine oxidase subunit gamma [Pseudaminobacter sp.]
MADFTWTTKTPIQHAVTPGHYGAAVKPAGLQLSEVRDFSLVLIAARRGRWQDVAQAAKARFGIEAPIGPRAVAGGKGVLIWSGPDQMMALFSRHDDIRPVDSLRETFAGSASLSDQSDGRCMIRISGPRARDMLAKVSSVDLYETAFPVGAAAATSIDHTGVNLWREPDNSEGLPVFSVLVFSSFADSLWHTLVDSSAEYGVDISHSQLS